MYPSITFQIKWLINIIVAPIYSSTAINCRDKRLSFICITHNVECDTQYLQTSKSYGSSFKIIYFNRKFINGSSSALKSFCFQLHKKLSKFRAKILLYVSIHVRMEVVSKRICSDKQTTFTKLHCRWTFISQLPKIITTITKLR